MSRSAVGLPSLAEFTAEYRTKPQRLISHCLGHEGKGSVLALLKQKGWATELEAGTADYRSSLVHSVLECRWPIPQSTHSRALQARAPSRRVRSRSSRCNSSPVAAIVPHDSGTTSARHARTGMKYTPAHRPDDLQQTTCNTAAAKMQQVTRNHTRCGLGTLSRTYSVRAGGDKADT